MALVCGWAVKVLLGVVDDGQWLWDASQLQKRWCWCMLSLAKGDSMSLFMGHMC